MFQSFDASTTPEQGPPRLAALRERLKSVNLDGFLIPRADAHQGEYVAPRDNRLAYLTGFTGSAGFCAALVDIAGVFVDGRYRVQVKEQVAPCFTPVDWPETSLSGWLKTHLSSGNVGFDPWLHTVQQLEQLERDLATSDIALVPTENTVDHIWVDQPAPPMAQAQAYPIEYAGDSHSDKRQRLAKMLRDAGQTAAVITLPDSIAWLLNIRGADIARNPVAHGFAILHSDARVDLFMAAPKLTNILDHLGPDIGIHAPETLLTRLAGLDGPQATVRLDKSSVPMAIASALRTAKIKICYADDPCVLPKACKNPTEIAGTTQAHLRDAAAMCEFLTWFDANVDQGLTEIDVVQALEAKRRDTGALLEISFDTIAGSGPNGALPHYRVTHGSNRTLKPGELLVLDSGGQYIDGTTDITRTLPIGAVAQDEREAFTRVLQGVIAISQLRWPVGLAGRDLEAVGRIALWQAGQDFDHGLGHGVGTYLCVHEGPQRLSRASHVPLKSGMILSNEPGYYREGAFGIRIENLIVVEQAPKLPTADARAMLQFRTLTWVPINTRLIVTEMLTNAEKSWLNTYHATCRDVIGAQLSKAANLWLNKATAPV